MSKKILFLLNLCLAIQSQAYNTDHIVNAFTERPGVNFHLNVGFPKGNIFVLRKKFVGFSREHLENAVRIVQSVLGSQEFEQALRQMRNRGFEFRHEEVRSGENRVLRGFQHNPLRLKPLDQTSADSILQTLGNGKEFGIVPSVPKGLFFSSVRAHAADEKVHLNIFKFKAKLVSQSDDVFFGYCNTIAHELIHLFGYEHGTGSSYNRNSIPYVIGDIVEELIRRV